ncbi:YciI family protein [Pseudactinotalea suaedae]|uniref:YciI family protein n=1 Tax=Pseudactinotalea suaedae TaxID=1524924 RepID=UPI0012E1412E|nr:YciI family protein [Pseudactinotalea suaedae]
MTTFLVLIYGNEQAWDGMSDEEQAAIDAGHRDLVAAAGPGVLASGQLGPAERATTLRADATGRRTRTTGPFVESTEVIGGYYVIEARDLDEVVGWAERLHESAASHGGVEIRPLHEPT